MKDRGKSFRTLTPDDYVKTFFFATDTVAKTRRHRIQHNDTQHNDTQYKTNQHNDSQLNYIQQKKMKRNTQHNDNHNNNTQSGVLLC
jgi:hypothetical protein